MGENDAKTLQVDANFLKTEKKRYTGTCGQGQCEISFFLCGRSSRNEIRYINYSHSIHN